MDFFTKKSKPSEAARDSDWDHLLRGEDKFNDYEYPKVSIVIPAFDCAQTIALTLDSVLVQDYPDFEILVVDAGSMDPTLEIVKSYRDDRIRIFTVSSYRRYEMMNKGITQASGYYINFLFPGDFYIHRNALHHLMTLALNQGKPHLVYCGTLIRDGRTEVKILYRQLTLNLLKRGQQPTSLQSCWWRVDTFAELGKFNTGYRLRGGYDLMCRFLLKGNLTCVSSNRVLTDYDLRLVTRRMIIRHFLETLYTVQKYFGAWAVLKWCFIQKDFSRFLGLWYRSLRGAFMGR